jgi:hypothetical protein
MAGGISKNPLCGAAVRARQRRLQIRAERIEIHHGAQTLLRVKKSLPVPSCLPPLPSPAAANQIIPRRRQRFFEVSGFRKALVFTKLFRKQVCDAPGKSEGEKPFFLHNNSNKLTSFQTNYKALFLA